MTNNLKNRIIKNLNIAIFAILILFSIFAFLFKLDYRYITIINALIALLGVFMSRKTRKEDKTDNLIKELENRELQKPRYFIFNVWKGRSPPSIGIRGTDEDGKSKPYSVREWENTIKNFLTKMNNIGYSYCKEDINHDKIVDLYATIIIESWDFCEKFINLKREREEKYQEYFEEMVNNIEEKYKRRDKESYEHLKKDIENRMKD